MKELNKRPSITVRAKPKLAPAPPSTAFPNKSQFNNKLSSSKDTRPNNIDNTTRSLPLAPIQRATPDSTKIPAEPNKPKVSNPYAHIKSRVYLTKPVKKVNPPNPSSPTSYILESGNSSSQLEANAETGKNKQIKLDDGIPTQIIQDGEPMEGHVPAEQNSYNAGPTSKQFSSGNADPEPNSGNGTQGKNSPPVADAKRRRNRRGKSNSYLDDQPEPNPSDSNDTEDGKSSKVKIPVHNYSKSREFSRAYNVNGIKLKAGIKKHRSLKENLAQSNSSLDSDQLAETSPSKPSKVRDKGQGRGRGRNHGFGMYPSDKPEAASNSISAKEVMWVPPSKQKFVLKISAATSDRNLHKDGTSNTGTQIQKGKRSHSNLKSEIFSWSKHSMTATAITDSITSVGAASPRQSSRFAREKERRGVKTAVARRSRPTVLVNTSTQANLVSISTTYQSLSHSTDNLAAELRRRRSRSQGSNSNPEKYKNNKHRKYDKVKGPTHKNHALRSFQRSLHHSLKPHNAKTKMPRPLTQARSASVFHSLTSPNSTHSYHNSMGTVPVKKHSLQHSASANISIATPKSSQKRIRSPTSFKLESGRTKPVNAKRSNTGRMGIYVADHAQAQSKKSTATMPVQPKKSAGTVPAHAQKSSDVLQSVMATAPPVSTSKKQASVKPTRSPKHYEPTSVLNSPPRNPDNHSKSTTKFGAMKQSKSKSQQIQKQGQDETHTSTGPLKSKSKTKAARNHAKLDKNERGTSKTSTRTTPHRSPSLKSNAKNTKSPKKLPSGITIVSELTKLQKTQLPILWTFGYPHECIVNNVNKTLGTLSKHLNFYLIDLDKEIANWINSPIFLQQQREKFEGPGPSDPSNTTDTDNHEEELEQLTKTKSITKSKSRSKSLTIFKFNSDLVMQATKILTKVIGMVNNVLPTDDILELITLAMIRAQVEEEPKPKGYIIKNFPVCFSEGDAFKNYLYEPTTGIYILPENELDRLRNESLKLVEGQEFFSREREYSEKDVREAVDRFGGKYPLQITMPSDGSSPIREGKLQEIFYLVESRMQMLEQIELAKSKVSSHQLAVEMELEARKLLASRNASAKPLATNTTTVATIFAKKGGEAVGNKFKNDLNNRQGRQTLLQNHSPATRAKNRDITTGAGAGKLSNQKQAK